MNSLSILRLNIAHEVNEDYCLVNYSMYLYSVLSLPSGSSQVRLLA